MNNSTANLTTTESSTDATSGLMDNSVYVYIHFINMLLGFPTHSYVMWLIVTGPKSGLALVFFNLNLSACEIGKCLNSLLSVFIYYCRFSSLTKLADSMAGLGITGRPLFQCLICVERYLAVVHPVTFLKYKPLRYRAICCAVAWIIVIFSCLFCMFAIDWFQIYSWYFSIQLLLYLSVALFCCLAVLRALKQSGPGERKKEENHMKRRAFHVILITTVNMVFIYGPFAISGFSFIMTQDYIKELFSFSFICSVLANLVHPALFLHQTGKLHCLCFRMK